jgi:hypothetical protein
MKNFNGWPIDPRLAPDLPQGAILSYFGVERVDSVTTMAAYGKIASSLPLSRFMTR